MTAVVGEVTASEIILDWEAAEKLVRHSRDCLFVVQLGGECVDGNTFHNLF